MKKNRLGFTLVELLASIIIIAILLVISGPAINNIINGSKQDSFKTTVRMVGKSIENKMLEGMDVVCDNREYNIQGLELNNVKRLNGTWSCSNNQDKAVYKLVVTDGEFFVELSSSDLEDDFEIGDYNGPLIKLNDNLTNSYEIDNKITISLDDITVKNSDKVLFTVYENDKVLIENTDQKFEYNANSKASLRVVYTASSIVSNKSVVRNILVNGKKINDKTLENLVNSGDGLYKFNENEYLYKGNVTNNYVWYSGYLWRIMGVSEGKTKLVLEDSITSLPYNRHKTNGSAYKNSYAEQWLINKFLPTINNRLTIATTGNWCNEGTSNKDSIRNTCNTKVESFVGLITLDEYNFSGGKNGYLNTNESFYTMTPTGLNYTLYAIDPTGEIYGKNNSYDTALVNYFGIRPTIFLADNAKYISGDGTSNTPYMLENDNKGRQNDLVNTRYAGEYVLLNNKLFRIVSVDAQGTKLVMDDVFRNADNTVKAYPWFEPNIFLKDKAIGNDMNTEIYNNLFDDSTKNMINNDSLWFRYNFLKSNDALVVTLPNPLTTLADTTNQVTSTVGMLNIGELFASQSGLEQFEYYWTFSFHRNTSTNQVYNWYVNNNNQAVVSDASLNSIRAIRPAVIVKSDVKISTGIGTKTNPYKIER